LILTPGAVKCESAQECRALRFVSYRNDDEISHFDLFCLEGQSQQSKILTVRKAGGDPMHINVNGEDRVIGDDVDPRTPLLWILRDHLGLVGAKYGCGIAQCGACTVHVDGKPVRSCQLTVDNVGNRAITTIEAIGNTPNGAKIQAAWIDIEVPQCGYCQAGQIMSATALLNRTPNPDDSDIDAAMAGNICRCGTYIRIRQAIKNAAAKSV
jgi:isoquinoline 1-oxidoreductase alpha subunit